MISSFPPFLPDSPKILILGTMPGAMSLLKQEYYAHPQNSFWKIMFTLFSGLPVPSDFETKKKLILDNHIALWDVLESCERKGSLDSQIRNAVENKIPDLIKHNPSIRAIFFNGQESHKIFVRKFGNEIDLPRIVLPSTSPAHTMKFDKKLEAWSQIEEFL
ncbi:DNA-deoxyinosine glycosylase [Flavobacterium silvaticum]|uniref:DNA-deoxyinosine glycosylase n=1 Tax=Flavobacterium silvaticum TaxID=1852020 RepID=A0A972FNQ4_9FLAO|nr:DNA-deoxyinosine glycosylase [Flavobacterium silvaticum]NMH29073.1 DNA-deoxyinosine glycosylase [Flavobacterium silvaticum]